MPASRPRSRRDSPVQQAGLADRCPHAYSRTARAERMRGADAQARQQAEGVGQGAGPRRGGVMGGTVSAKRPVEHGSRGPGAGDQSPSRGTGPVLLRAARLLEAFSHDRPTLTLSELARRSGLPLTTAYRLVADLVACGFLERDEHDLYHIGLKLWEIASLAPQRESLRDAALPFMEDLFQVTSENVQLAVREGEESVFVERLSGHRSIPVINRVGGRLPLHPTGVGRVLLAFAPQDVQEKVLASPLKSFS